MMLEEYKAAQQGPYPYEVFFIHTGQCNEERQTGEHTHNYWQLEIGVSGTIRTDINGYCFTINPDTAFCIPPGFAHNFIYPLKNVRWVTYKFHLFVPYDTKHAFLYTWKPSNNSTDSYTRAKNCPTTNQRQSIAVDSHPPAPKLSFEEKCQMLRGLERVNLPSNLFIIKVEKRSHPVHIIETLKELAYDNHTDLETRKAYMGGLLLALAHVSDLNLPYRKQSDPFIQKIDRLVNSRKGLPLTLDDISNTLLLSSGHISNLFKQKTGIPIKTYIDCGRADYLHNLIIYTELPFKAIASETGFPDIYSFSRFVKRLLGRSPKELRQGERGKSSR